MATRIGRVNAADLLKEVTLEVEITGIRSFRVRLWIAKQCMVLIGKILGVGRVEVKGVD